MRCLIQAGLLCVYLIKTSMKKCLLIAVSAILAVSAGVLVNYHSTGLSLIGSDIEALTMTECISASAGNDGKCEAAINGSGDVCVDGHWWQFKDCVSHQ